MGRRDYPRLSIEEFGRHLITSGDLDPVYIALVDMNLERDQLMRWLVAYWCLYHCGAASYISEIEGEDFWRELYRAAENDRPAPTEGRWPRGHERRHFRGEQGRRAVIAMHDRYGARPEGMVERMILSPSSPVDFATINSLAQEERGFGPWIAFKVGDMLDRLALQPVDFSEGHIFMFKDPVKAAMMLWRERTGYGDNARPRDQAVAIHEVVEYLKGEFSDLRAPPLNDRPVDLQEVETALCKWKSHMNGHYPLNNDIDEINAGLEPWMAHSSTARVMRECMPLRLDCELETEYG